MRPSNLDATLPTLARVLLALVAAYGGRAAAQAPTDSVSTQILDELVVTASRSETPLVAPGVPVDVVSRAEADDRGAVRIADLLSAVGGYTVDHAFGAGLQLQGLGPEYTLILIDGEPVVGRLNGTLDLDRLGVAGLERVEVLRGPSSSLYGADALAGVVNLITRAPAEALRAEGGLRVESHGTSDASADVGFALGRVTGSATLRHYRSGAYDVDPLTPYPTSPAYSGLDGAVRMRVRLPLAIGLRLAARAGVEDQREGTEVDLPPGSAPLTGQGLRNDASGSVGLDRAGVLGGRLSVATQFSHYGTETSLAAADGDTLASRFDQWAHRGEIKYERMLGARHLVTAGAGGTLETVSADRIGGGTRASHAAFAFLEEQWRASDATDVAVSARFDAPADYAARFSPSASVLHRLSGATRLRLAIGSGFKAPSFQQRYLDFTNVAGGYTVIGASDVSAVLARYESEGIIERYETGSVPGGPLRPETSTSLNAGAEHRLSGALDIRANAFWNHVSDLIDIVPVATLTNGRQVYTYVNLDRVRTRGVELGLDWAPAPWAGVGLRYQLLDAVDLGALDAIEAGLVFTRENGVDRRLTRDEYGGLFGRSRHSGSIDVRLRTPVRGLSTVLRGVFRSRYGDFDRNGNLVLDDRTEYVRAQPLAHVTLNYAATAWLSLQAGVENAFDYTDPQRAPSIAGRRWFAGLRVTRINH